MSPGRRLPLSILGLLALATAARAPSCVQVVSANAAPRVERAGVAAAGGPAPLSVRITAPRGRLASTGPIRIVARVTPPPGLAVASVKFYLDDQLLGEDATGPAYAVEWTDENPYLAHRIRVEAADAAGHHAEDDLALEPLEVLEDAQITRVLLDASVQDAEGRSVAGLTASNFAIFEDDAPQTIDMLAADTVPSTFLLLVDRSQSMSYRMDFVQRAGRRLVDYLRPQDRMVVVPFSRTLGSVTGPTSDHQTVSDAIAAIESGGGTAIYDAVRDAAARLDAVDGRRAIVLLTDGYDEHSRGTIDMAIAALGRAHVTLYAVGVGGTAGISLAGQAALTRLARASGGRAYFPFRDEDLPGVHERIAGDVQHRYLVSYTPTNDARDGRWRQIRIEVAPAGLRVYARPGYVAPAPPPIRPAIEFTVKDTAKDDAKGTAEGAAKGTAEDTAEDTVHAFADFAAEDFTIVEDGVPQQIQRFGEAVTPLSIVVALDASGSMKASAAAVQAAARGFVDCLRSQDRLAIELFNDRVRFESELSTHRQVSLMAVDAYAARGGTALYDAVGDALARLKAVEGRGALVLLTDGRDENQAGDGPGSARTQAAILEDIRASNVTIYAIGLGTNVDRALLARLAADTHGEAYFPDDVSQLANEYQRVLERLRRRYVVSYTSTNTARDGRWRAVDVRSRAPHVAIDSAGGYFAPNR
jgi:VWFA-related protein